MASVLVQKGEAECALLPRWNLLGESAEESQPPCAHKAAPDVPLQLAFSPHSPASSTLLPPVPSCLPSGTSVLLLCFPGPPSQTPFTSQGFRHPGAGPAELLWLAPAGLGLQEGGLSCPDWCHWKFMGPNRGWMCSAAGHPFSCPSSAVSPIILGSSLRPLPFSLGLSPCPAFHQASDLAFYITEKIEAFNLNSLSRLTEHHLMYSVPLSYSLGTLDPFPSTPHPVRPRPHFHCLHHEQITPKTPLSCPSSSKTRAVRKLTVLSGRSLKDPS